MYLLLHRELRNGKFTILFRKLPSIEELDDMNYLASFNGLMLMTLSLMLGFAWSYINLGFFPMSDPKVLATVFTILVYLCILVFKLLFGWHGKRIAVLSVCGFIIILALQVAVNLLPRTFHGTM
jgi:ABC-type transport system involved in cytochrome c biogenesis permease subunit